MLACGTQVLYTCKMVVMMMMVVGLSWPSYIPILSLLTIYPLSKTERWLFFAGYYLLNYS
jgi:hypothetical protein